MRFSEEDLESIINDDSKSIDADLVWQDDEDHFPSKEFRTDVQTDAGHPLFIYGHYSPTTEKLSFTLVHRRVGRIYGLDLGADHCNPNGDYVGQTHKHRWSDCFRDECAYAPEDITAPWDQPVRVWEQFCAEARICHNGELMEPTEQLEFPQ